jgi:DNA-binding XRE family transcriptional regulator
MRNGIKIPRILKIISIDDLELTCIFSNGETRKLNFKRLFKVWKIGKKSPEYKLLNEVEFRKVELRNRTLSWKNVGLKLPKLGGGFEIHPYELSPDILFKESEPVEDLMSRFNFGKVIKTNRLKQGLSQDDLAALSGTSKTYISRAENNLIVPELKTLLRIVEVGLGIKMKIAFG